MRVARGPGERRPDRSARIGHMLRSNQDGGGPWGGGGMDKMLIEKAGGTGVVPYLPLDELLKRKPAQPAQPAQQEQKGSQQ